MGSQTPNAAKWFEAHGINPNEVQAHSVRLEEPGHRLSWEGFRLLTDDEATELVRAFNLDNEGDE